MLMLFETQKRLLSRPRLWRGLAHAAPFTHFSSDRRRASSPKTLCKSSYELSPEIVESVLHKCPSDVLSLDFFLWSARQPGYFHDRPSFELMVPVVCRLSDRFCNVSRIVGELERIGCHRKAQALLVLLRIYWYGGMYELALEAFDEMRRQDFVPNTFARNVVLDILFKIGDSQVALNFFKATHLPNFITYNIVLRNLYERGDWVQVRSLVREMVREGFRPNSGTFLMVLDCFCKFHLMRDALQVLGLMIVSGVGMSVTVWTMLVNGYFKAGGFDVVGEFLDKLIITGYSPNAVTYTSLVKGFYESQMVEEAQNLLNVMHSRDCQPDLVLFNVLIHLFGKAGRFNDAIDLFYDLCHRNLKPDSYTLSSSLWVLCSSKNWSLPSGLGLDINISTESLDLVMCNSLLSFFRKAGYPSQAVDLYIYMIDKGFKPNNYSIVELLTSLCKSGRTQNAETIYQEIIGRNYELDSYTQTTIIVGLMSKRKISMAMELFETALLEQKCCDVVSFTAVIHGILKSGRLLEALQVYALMKHLDVLPNNYTYDSMLFEFAKANKVEAVKFLLNEMEITGIELGHISFKTMSLLIRRSMVDLKLLSVATDGEACMESKRVDPLIDYNFSCLDGTSLSARRVSEIVL